MVSKKKSGLAKAPALAVAFTSEQLIGILAMLNEGDTNVIKSGEEQLKPFLKHHSCIVQLISVLSNCPNEIVRLQAALLLKKKIGSHFKSFTVAEQDYLKETLLTIGKSEPDRNCQIGIVGCIANLAKVVFGVEGGAWPALFQTLLVLGQEGNSPALRALNFSLLEQLAETIAVHLKSHMETIAGLLAQGCVDAELGVKVSAMRAICSFIVNIADSPEVLTLQPIIVPVMQVMQACLANGDEEVVAEALVLFQEAAESPQPLINDHLESLVPFVVSIMENQTYEDEVKTSAASTLTSIIEKRPKLLGKKNMIPPILNAMVSLIAGSDGSEVGSLFQIGTESDDEGDEDFDGVEGSRNPQYILDAMALNIPSKYFVQPALEVCSHWIKAEAGNHRKAGCFLLGVITEGCADSLRIILNQLLPAVLSSVQDPEFFVREVACFTLGQMSEHCQPEILHYHKEILPVVFNALNDERPNVQNTTCYVLEMFCEHLQPETLKPHLPPLLQKLCALLQSPSRTTKEMALTAIAATAVAAELEFLPFAETICGILHGLLFLKEEKMFPLRGRSLECLGHVAVAIGKDNFARYFNMGMQSALEALQTDNEGIKEHSYVFFANSSKIMCDQMAPHIPVMLQNILETIQEREVEVYGDEDEDDEDEEVDYQDIHVVDGMMNTKKAAVTALGALAQNTGVHFDVNCLSQSMQVLITSGLTTVHEEVKAEVLECFQYLVIAACKLYGLPSAPKQQEMIALHPELAKVVQTAVVICLQVVSEDEEKRVVAAAVESIGGILLSVGIATLALPAASILPLEEEEVDAWAQLQIAPVLMEAVKHLVAEQTVCQKVENGEEEDEDEDHDQTLIDQVSDLIGNLAKTMGVQFIPYFDQLWEPLLKFAKPSRSHSDRSMAIGCFAEVIMEIGEGSAKYVEALMPFIQSGLLDPMEGVRRNSAYCIGTMVQAIKAPMIPHYQTFLMWLSPLCTRSADKAASDAGGADIDNALSAVARMIDVSRESVPLPSVLPVMLSAMPLRADFGEGENIFKVISSLITSKEPTTLSMLPLVLVQLGHTLEPDSKANDETKALTKSCLQHISREAELGPIFQNAVSAIPDASMSALLKDQAQ